MRIYFNLPPNLGFCMVQLSFVCFLNQLQCNSRSLDEEYVFIVDFPEVRIQGFNPFQTIGDVICLS